MQRRTVISGALGAIGTAALPRAGQAATADMMATAFKICTETPLVMSRYAQALNRAGWAPIKTRSELEIAATVLGDSLSVQPYRVPGQPNLLNAKMRARSRANVASSVVAPNEDHMVSLTWVHRDQGGDSYINVRQGIDGKEIWCAAATTDATGGRTFLRAVWPGAPEIEPQEMLLRATARSRTTPLFGPSTRSEVTLTEFNRERIEGWLQPPFDPATGFLIISKPGRR